MGGGVSATAVSTKSGFSTYLPHFELAEMPCLFFPSATVADVHYCAQLGSYDLRVVAQE